MWLQCAQEQTFKYFGNVIKIRYWSVVEVKLIDLKTPSLVQKNLMGLWDLSYI